MESKFLFVSLTCCKEKFCFFSKVYKTFSIVLFLVEQVPAKKLGCILKKFSLTWKILALLVKGTKKGACFNISFALVPSIVAWGKMMLETSNTSWTLWMQLRTYYLRNEKIIDTVGMEVTWGHKFSPIVPILQLQE